MANANSVPCTISLCSISWIFFSRSASLSPCLIGQISCTMTWPRSTSGIHLNKTPTNKYYAKATRIDKEYLPVHHNTSFLDLFLFKRFICALYGSCAVKATRKGWVQVDDAIFRKRIDKVCRQNVHKASQDNQIDPIGYLLLYLFHQIQIILDSALSLILVRFEEMS